MLLICYNNSQMKLHVLSQKECSQCLCFNIIAFPWFPYKCDLVKNMLAQYICVCKWICQECDKVIYFINWCIHCQYILSVIILCLCVFVVNTFWLIAFIGSKHFQCWQWCFCNKQRMVIAITFSDISSYICFYKS